MKEINCAMIKDILPLYTEGLTSEETNIIVAEHLASCEECKKFYESCKTDLEIPVEKANTSDRKIIRGMRFQMIWFMFWPMFYALSWKYGLEMRTLRLLIVALGLLWASMYYKAMETNLDPEARREFYQNEEKNINSDKGSSFVQTCFWSLPILIPILFDVIPFMIDYMKS